MQAILPPGPKEKDQIDEAKQIKINECPCVLYTNFVGQLKIVGSYGGIDGRNVEGVARGVVGRGRHPPVPWFKTSYGVCCLRQFQTQC